MVFQTKHRAWTSVYVLATTVIALGVATLSALPTPANVQAAPTSNGLSPCHGTINAIDPFLNQQCNPFPPPASSPVPPQRSTQPSLFTGITQARQKPLQ
jgi:hypothetical protein